MKIQRIWFLWLSMPLVAAAAESLEADVLLIEKGDFDARQLQPYQHTWRQCSKTDGRWSASTPLTESLDILTDKLMRHRQLTVRDDGIRMTSTTYFERGTFAPVRMATEILGPNDEPLAVAHRLLDSDGYKGFVVQGREMSSKEGSITSRMLSGSALGLPLATMTRSEGSIEFAASMMSFDATYRVIATWAGTEMLQHHDVDIEAQLIDIEWQHLESGDIYPAGPDASGGRFWVVANPPTGFPYVPRYQTDTYAVEFSESVCLSD